MSKYNILWKYISERGKSQFTLTFDDIAHIVGIPLDHSFLGYKKELSAYNYAVSRISMKTRTVTFYRIDKQNNKPDKKDTLILYIHGKNGSAAESEHYRLLFPNCDVIGLDYKSTMPWEACVEFPAAFDKLTERYKKIILIANSIGAYFAMCSLSQNRIEKAYFISPVVDMEKLILDMMRWANVSEAELKQAHTIQTSFGETLSWEYLTYVRNHPIHWDIPTNILYGTRDNLTSRDIISNFAAVNHAALTIMENGEHWFHTPEQMNFLDEWIRKSEI